MEKNTFLETRAKHPDYDFKKYGPWQDIPEKIDNMARIIYGVEYISINGAQGEEAVKEMLMAFAKRLIIQKTILEDLK